MTSIRAFSASAGSAGSRRAVGLALGAALVSLAVGATGCGPEKDYPHSTELVIGDDDTYEKNPDVKLAREYWIVIRAESGSYDMYPRPDGSPSIVEECTSNGPLAPMFENAELCHPATSTTLARVNALTGAEAMQTSTFLHQRLKFVAVQGATDLDGARVEPYPHTDDLLEICKTYPADRTDALKSVCDEELKYENADARPAIARIYTLDECRSMATRLNELYEIP